MQPYYEQDGITIYHGDAMRVMPELPPESVATVLTDPPYGIDYQSARRTDKSEWKPKIANDKQPFIWWLLDAYRVTRDQGSVFCFCRWDVQEPFRMAIEAAGFLVKGQCVWDRDAHGMGDIVGGFAPQHDVMWFGVKGDFGFHSERPKSLIRAARLAGAQLLHPNEKPLHLMEQLVRVLAASGETVLDPFMGSGTTLVAAKRLGRKAIGIELEEKYCEIAAKRLAQGALPMEFSA